MDLVKNTLFIALMLLTAFSCSDDEACLSNQHAVQTQLLSAWWDSEVDTTLTEVTVKGLGQEDSIYNNESASELFLPLNFDTDTTVFIITVKTLKDTLRLIAQRDLDFISRDCGYIFTFNLDTVIHTKTFIDSVSIIYPKIKYGETTDNIQLYIY